MDAAGMVSGLTPQVTARLEALDRDRVLERIRAGDHTVWKDDPTEIANRLGWLTVVEPMRERLGELESFAAEVAEEGVGTAVLLGMGGSSLAPEVLMRTFGGSGIELVVLDTTHPATVQRVGAGLDVETTVFVVASKSGTTIETLSHLNHFWEIAPKGDRFVAITDPGTPLESLAARRGFRASFANPEDIGGRFSALSYFGLVPGALVGAPLAELLDAARRMADAPDVAAENPGAVLGTLLGEAARRGRDKLTFVLPEPIASFGDWAEQLLAESTGKEGLGIVPVVDEPLGPPEVYGDDRLFVAIGDVPELDPLESAGHPVVRLPFERPEDLGAEFFRWELATAVAGHILDINPFDQPNVQEAKDATNQILAGEAVAGAGFDDPAAVLDQVRPGDYVALLAYLDRTPETERSLERVRLAIRDRHRVATTVGFGPRFLHSTGQLHKGGPNTGVFVQLVDDTRSVDVPIPGRDLTFGTLIDAQALGDLRSLRTRGRRVARTTVDALAEVI
ncbi:MAG TPA: glucose-6-phosphate isomerase [Actinomycetota bacterium]